MKEYSIPTGFFDRQLKLVLADEYIDWEKANSVREEFTRLNKSDIVDFKHGVKWTVWYRFTVGCNFSITFLDKKNKEFKIQFNTRFGLRKENHQTYSDIIDDIWELYHNDIVNKFLETFYNLGQAEIQGVKLTFEGVELKERKGFIPWGQVTTKDYYTYFAIYDRGNPDLHCRINFNEYGTETLWSALQTIIKEKQAGIQKS